MATVPMLVGVAVEEAAPSLSVPMAGLSRAPIVAAVRATYLAVHVGAAVSLVIGGEVSRATTADAASLLPASVGIHRK